MAVIERILRAIVGPASLMSIVAGVWGWLGWQAGLIALGLPPFVFYVWGEVRAARFKEPE